MSSCPRDRSISIYSHSIISSHRSIWISRLDITPVELSSSPSHCTNKKTNSAKLWVFMNFHVPQIKIFELIILRYLFFLFMQGEGASSTGGSWYCSVCQTVHTIIIILKKNNQSRIFTQKIRFQASLVSSFIYRFEHKQILNSRYIPGTMI